MDKKEKRENYSRKISLLAVFFAIGIVVFVAPSDLGAFLSAVDSNDSGRISTASPLGQSEFKTPGQNLTPLAPAEVLDYQKYQKAVKSDGRLYWQNDQTLTLLTPQEVATYNKYRQIINVGGQLFWRGKRNSEDVKLKTGAAPAKAIEPAAEEPEAEEPEQEAQLPPGIEKQGADKHEDNGKHLGWEKGKHKGWLKQEEKAEKTKLSELDLKLVSKDNKSKNKKENNLEDGKHKEKPKLNINNLSRPLEDKEDTFGLKQIKVKELKAKSSFRSNGQLRGAEIKVKTVAGEAR